jgi:ATP-dependent RNA helicase DDX54/DBP10
MDTQFGDLHTNPDIIIATPGRFLHVVVEMELSLVTMEYIVFDEADRCVAPRPALFLFPLSLPPPASPPLFSILFHLYHCPYPCLDRLFELGFAEQLREILARLPDSRQTALFSATLPRLLVCTRREGWGEEGAPQGALCFRCRPTSCLRLQLDFAKAGLQNPTLVRLDVDTKLPENLR